MADSDLGGQDDFSKVGYNRGLLGDNASLAAQIHDDGDAAFLAGFDDPRRFGEFGHCAAAGSVGVGDADLFVRSILEMKLEADIQFIWPRLVLLTQRVPGEDILDLQ